jgi:hypothetical protein
VTQVPAPIVRTPAAGRTRRKVLRGPAPIAAGLALAVAFSATALAARPERVFIDQGGEGTLQGVCDFDVLVTFDRNNEYTTYFGDGRILLTGQLFVTLTNLETGEAHAYQISGPSRDGTLNGQSIMFSFESEPAGGHLLLTHGPVPMTWSEDGRLLSYELTGSSTDLCAVLS